MSVFSLRKRNFFAGRKPPGVRWSQMLLGRRVTQDILEKRGEVVLSAYDTQDGRRFYAECPFEGPPGPRVLYRIRVKLKDRK